ncbi:MAG TPA: IS110 family transposase [Nocardioidaceae bacterium]
MSDGTAGKQVVGVDLHLHRSVIARVDDHGNELGWVRIDNDPRALRDECRKAGRGVPVAIEATYGWYWAVDALLAAGFEVHLAHPLGMKALRKRKRVKTDPADAYELANLLRLGSLPEAYISPPELRELRELVRHRRQLVKLATAVKAGIRALLAKHNIRLSAAQLESDTATGLLDALELPGTYAARLASQRRLMLVLAAEIAATEVDLHRRLHHHPGYRNLLTVKGIGPVLAAVFVAEIGDVTRFPTAGALCCWAGLTPRHYESDKTVHRGHISKEGDTLVRWAAVEAIQRQTEPAVKAVRERIVARRGKNARNIAKVAAARRMLEVVYYTLRDGQARCLTPADTTGTAA